MERSEWMNFLLKMFLQRERDKRSRNCTHFSGKINCSTSTTEDCFRWNWACVLVLYWVSLNILCKNWIFSYDSQHWWNRGNFSGLQFLECHRNNLFFHCEVAECLQLQFALGFELNDFFMDCTRLNLAKNLCLFSSWLISIKTVCAILKIGKRTFCWDPLRDLWMSSKLIYVKL